jgi:hypothetical protein
MAALGVSEMNRLSFFTSVLNSALLDVAAKKLPVFTFALYHDHESGAVSVCVDTEENSNRSVVSMNRYNMRYFMQALTNGDLKSAGLWQANIGRSLSLGDFALVNAARTSLGNLTVDGGFYLDMMKSLVAVRDQVAALAPEPERLVFACSGANDEVAFVWSYESAQQSAPEDALKQRASER